MAEFYLDPTAVGNEYEAYADTPAAWATPQDGNGLGSNAATAAVPVAEVTFAAVPTTGSISVYGATVTLTGVLGAGTTDAAATALASSINATTTALAAGVSALLLPLNRFVFARVKPGASSTVQIMSRFAGSDLNYPANASARVTNTFNNTAMTSPVDFTGGADGPWGYFFSTSAAFGRGEAAYGLLVAAAPTPAAVSYSDTIHVRSARSSIDATLDYESAANSDLVMVVPSDGRAFLFDDGTVWAGENGQFTVTIYKSAVSRTLTLSEGTNGKLSLVSRSRYNFSLFGKLNPSTSTGWHIRFGGNGGTFEAVRVKLGIDPTGGGRLQLIATFGSSVCHTESDISFKGTSNFGVNLTYAQSVIAINSTYRWVGAGGNIAAVLNLGNNSGATNLVRFSGCGFVVDDGAYSVSSTVDGSGLNAAGGFTIVETDNCSGVDNPSAGFPATTGLVPRRNTRFSWRDAKTGSWRYETPMFTSEWNESNASAYPTKGILNVNGVLMGCRVSWEGVRLAGFNLMQSDPPQVAFFVGRHRDSTAVRTLTVEMLVPDIEVPNASQVYAEFSYVDSNGVRRTQSTFVPYVVGRLGSAPALANGAGVGAWVLNGVTDVVSKKLSITTDYPVLTDTAVSATIRFGGDAPTSSYSMYFSPAVEVT